MLVVLILAVVLLPRELAKSELPSEVYIPVLRHSQVTSYNCGPADLEMIFDYFGPDVDQLEIADVARTQPNPFGTFTCDMVRAAHFSNLSTSVGSQLDDDVTGYTGRDLGYAAFETSLTLAELKSVLAQDYPIIMLWAWHYRIAVGYNSTHFLFRNSLKSSLENLTNQQFLTSWNTSGNWSLLVSPWKVEISAPRNILPGNFTVTARIHYPCPYPFSNSMYSSRNSTVTINLPEGLILAPGEQDTVALNEGNMDGGSSAKVSWTVEADNLGFYVISATAEGLIEGFAPEIPNYPSYEYQDRIGGENQSLLAVTSTLDEISPVTVDDYDGLWHNQNLMINLAATDENSGVYETHYKINKGPAKAVSLEGQPCITSESANNTLEYWSVDNAGNSEAPRLITDIKIEKTPPAGYITINNYTFFTNSTSVILGISGNDTASGIAEMCFSNDNATWTQWQPFNQSVGWTLLPVDGVKTVYAKLRDNIGWVSAVFTDRIWLDTSPPSVTSLMQTPENEIQPNQSVKIVANVTDKPSSVKEVTLFYSLNHSTTWTDLPMILNETTNLYETTIPGQSIGTLVQYKIVAYDHAGNQAIDDDNGYFHSYVVVFELSPILTLIMFTVYGTLARIARKTLAKSKQPPCFPKSRREEGANDSPP